MLTDLKKAFLCVCAFVCIQVFAAASALAGPFDSVGRYLSGQMDVEALIADRLQTNGRAVEKVVQDYEALVLFYESRHFRPVWVEGSKISSRAKDFYGVLQGSWTHGLNPNRYHLSQIDTILNQKSDQELADLELLLTDAFVRFAHDLSGIRVDPASMDSSRKFWRQPMLPADILKSLEAAKDPLDVLEALTPQGQTYQRFRRELERLLDSDPNDYESVLPIRFEGNLHPYERSQAVPALRVRLGLAGGEAVSDPLVYDDTLAAEVIKFQRQNHIKADGIVGGQTLELLNRTRTERIEQVIANLERLRWVEEDRPDKFVVVNIPSATLWAVENGQVAFEMPVIVGRGKRPTNSFITEITGVRFNPNWTVPPTIKREDILPKLQEDPTYLSQKGMQLIRGSGVEAIAIDPLAVDWVNMTEADLRQFRMVQTPGAHNPLGRVRVLMPNAYNIYLHDTNQPEYFNRAARAESSGCVRMSEPEKMAEFILRSRPGWSEAAMKSSLESGKMRDIAIPEPIKIYLLYYTIWIGENGDIIYGNDLYGYDRKLIKLLKAIDGFAIPVDNVSGKDG